MFDFARKYNDDDVFGRFINSVISNLKNLAAIKDLCALINPNR